MSLIEVSARLWIGAVDNATASLGPTCGDCNGSSSVSVHQSWREDGQHEFVGVAGWRLQQAGGEVWISDAEFQRYREIDESVPLDAERGDGAS